MLKTIRNHFVLIIGIMGISSVPSAMATLAWDGFDYPADSGLRNFPSGANGGVGWGGTWSTAAGSSFATNRSPGLSYGALPTIGGHLEVGDPAGLSTGTTSAQRAMPGTLGGMGFGTYWISFLYQNLNTADQITGSQTGFRQANLGLFSTATVSGSGISQVNGGERFAIGAPNNYSGQPSFGQDVMTMWNGANYSYSSTATARGVSQPATWVVMKIVVDNTVANDTVYAWFNPSLASEPDAGAATVYSASDLSAVNAIRFQVGGTGAATGPAGRMNVDELRVGTGWSEMLVVPEPSSLAFVGLGALAILHRLRRK